MLFLINGINKEKKESRGRQSFGGAWGGALRGVVLFGLLGKVTFDLAHFEVRFCDENFFIIYFDPVEHGFGADHPFF
jgi:hypothetical protein